MRKFRIEDSPAVTVLLNDYLGSITSSFNIASHDHGLWSEENEDAIVIKHNHHQESSTWPQCTQTRMSNIGSCPRCSPSNLNKPNVNRVGDCGMCCMVLTLYILGEHHRGLCGGEAGKPWNYHRFCKVRLINLNDMWRSNPCFP